MNVHVLSATVKAKERMAAAAPLRSSFLVLHPAARSSWIRRRRAGLMPRVAIARRGMTLLEICVVIGVGSIIFATAVVVVAALLRSRVDQKQQRYFAATRTRLADQFREDVRAANQWRADGEEGLAWVLELSGDELVRYHVEGSALLRVRRNKGVDVARERFSQTADTTFAIHKIAAAEGRSPLVELVIDYPGDRHSTGRKRHHVVGNLAADSRFVFR